MGEPQLASAAVPRPYWFSTGGRTSCARPIPIGQAQTETLLPILHDVGADPGQPQVSPVHNSIKG